MGVKKVDTGISTGAVVWLTGMSGAGKSTIAQALVERLRASCIRATALDGDVLRTGLNGDLGFTEADRTENLRRVAHVAALFCQEGFVAITATISPEPEHRDNARRIVGAGSFVEVFVDTPFEVCEERDPKGLYKRARRGEIPQFTGIGSPYHAPDRPDLTVRTQGNSVEHCVDDIVEHLARKHHIGSVRSQIDGHKVE
ncbi:adenylyl-sulfate kinase [Paraburkholderia tropica]|uniref:adenylyl-sulfate kinase n=1 Tax=Paraburkholderia tropica TaxID=92647 RepID=UPI002AB7DC16|nr:adenylyl-sulfate kinase [Paraburkholderia tropica]